MNVRFINKLYFYWWLELHYLTPTFCHVIKHLQLRLCVCVCVYSSNCIPWRVHGPEACVSHVYLSISWNFPLLLPVCIVFLWLLGVEQTNLCVSGRPLTLFSSVLTYGEGSSAFRSPHGEEQYLNGLMQRLHLVPKPTSDS